MSLASRVRKKSVKAPRLSINQPFSSFYCSVTWQFFYMIKFYYDKSSHVKADNFSQSVSPLKTKMISTYMAKSFIVPGLDSLIHLQGENITFSVLLDKDCYKEHTFTCIIILPCTHIPQHACRLLNRSLPTAGFFFLTTAGQFGSLSRQ